MESDKPRYWHEYYLPDKPVRLYMDVDDKQMLPTWDAFIAKLCSKVNELLQAEYTPIVLQNHKPNKFSVHLLWPKWFETPRHLHAFMTLIKAAVDNDERLDMAVYSKSSKTAGCLRSPYSEKRDSPGALIPAGASPEFDRVKFLESLITYGNTAENMISSEWFPIAPSTRALVHDTNEFRAKALERLEEWLREFWGVDRVLETQALDVNTGEWIWTMQPGVWCTKARRRHVRNRTMLRGTIAFDAVASVELMCLDPECKEWIACKEFDWSKIMFVKD